MRRAASVSAEAFPDSVQVGENALPLNYEFDPTADSDGVSVDIPLALLNQVSKEQLDWLVPGLIGEVPRADSLITEVVETQLRTCTAGG